MVEKEKSKAEILGENTMQAKLGLWTANLRDNLQRINSCSDITTLTKLNNPALCIGAGESTKLHYDEIKQFKGTIISCERNLVDLLEHDIIPDYVLSIDGSEIMTKFIDHPLVNKYIDNMTGVFATTVSPLFLSKWKGKTIFFNAWLDDINEIKSVSLVLQELTRKATMITGGNAGSTCWFLAYYLQANPIVMIGIDFAYPMSVGDLSNTQIWDGIKHLPQEKILEHYRKETNKFGNEIITDYVWDGFMTAWQSWIKEMQLYKTIQCSDYSIVQDEPIVVMKFSEYLNQQGEVIMEEKNIKIREERADLTDLVMSLPELSLVSGSDNKSLCNEVLNMFQTVPQGMTEFQIKNFVLGDLDYPNADSKWWQAKLELWVRMQNIISMHYDFKKRSAIIEEVQASIDELKYNIENLDEINKSIDIIHSRRDNAKIKKFQVEIEENEFALVCIKKGINDKLKEMKTFWEAMQELRPLMKYGTESKEEQEYDHWLAIAKKTPLMIERHGEVFADNPEIIARYPQYYKTKEEIRRLEATRGTSNEKNRPRTT